MSISASIRERWNAPQGYREVLRVSLPLIAGMVSSTVMQFTDRLFLSHYSVTSITAALPGTMGALVLQLALVGLCGYVSVFIAQYVGANRPDRVGVVLWQGMWMALAGTVILALCCLLAEPLFAWAGHPPDVRAEEIIYFRILTLGSGFWLAGAVVGGFYIGRGFTRPVLVANLAGAILNVPLDYAMIFGACGLPEMGIAGAGLATAVGWAFCAIILAVGVFSKANDRKYTVRRAWRFDREIFGRLLRFGVPSGFNLFMEVIGFTWFIFEVGKLDQVQAAASNIVFSINSLLFMPMLGMNAGVSSLVGQAMGGKKPLEAERATTSALHMCLGYMVPMGIVIVLLSGPLMDMFRPSDSVDYTAIRETGRILLCFVALYSLADGCNLVYLGVLKGAGDTFFIMLMLAGTGFFVLVLPILAQQYWGVASLYSLWVTLSVYIVALALLAYWRFRQGCWQRMRVIEV